MLQVMSSHSNICDQIHLPLQAGSDRILKRMNRSYTSTEFLNLVDKIREYMPNCSLTTDIIVGFPGETEEEFLETLSIVEKVKFNFAYMFKYSSRPGTKAAQYDEQISESIKQDRLERLIDLQLQNTLYQNKKLVGKTVKVLVEKVSKKSKYQWSGRTEGGIWVVFDKTNEKIGEIIDVNIDDARGVTLFGSRTYQGIIMKLLKYFLFLMIFWKHIFLISLNELNTIDGMPTTIKIPFMDSDEITSNGYNVDSSTYYFDSRSCHWFYYFINSNDFT